MSTSGFVKRIQNIMRNDSGVNGDAQRIEQIVWILFLKIYDAKEQIWELYEDDYQSIIPEGYKWRDWAIDKKDGEALTGGSLLEFVNNDLFPTLKGIEIDERTPIHKAIVKTAFDDANNYQKDGILLRQVVNVIDEIDFTEYKERNEFGAIYESFLKDIQSAGNAGEFYTPRAVTDFMVKVVNPVLGEKIADFASGTGGFLTSALNALDKQIGNSLEKKELYDQSIHGVEKKSLPYLLSLTNMLIHDIDEPYILHDNSLEINYRDMRKMEAFDVILMNPPYGGNEKESVKVNFPTELRSSETADLFMNVIMYRLKLNGRAAVIIPNGFLFGTDNAKYNIKKKLFNEFNVHTIVRMPPSVFAPYTSIQTNIIFFDNKGTTKETWFYRVDMPEGYKHFSKTRPMQLEHFQGAIDWWNDREEIELDGYPKAKRYSLEEIEAENYNIDLCRIPQEEEIILDPNDLIQEYQEKRASLNDEIDHVLKQITSLIGGKE